MDWSQTRAENLVVSGSWDHTAKVVRNGTNHDEIRLDFTDAASQKFLDLLQ